MPAIARHPWPHTLRRTHAQPKPRTSEAEKERPLWLQVALLYAGIFVLFVLLTTVCFVSAWLAAGSAY